MFNEHSITLFSIDECATLTYFFLLRLCCANSLADSITRLIRIIDILYHSEDRNVIRVRKLLLKSVERVKES